MKPFIFQEWHAWAGVTGILLSDQNASKLRHFPTIEATINWLFQAGEKDAARALNEHKKENK